VNEDASKKPREKEARMRRHLVMAVALVALALAVLNTFLFRGQDASSARQADGSQLLLSRLEDRLNRLETRMRDTLAQLEGAAAAPISSEAAESAQGGERIPSNLPEEIVRLRSQVSALSYRIQALEQDPLNRGYTYIGSENPALRLEGINALRRIAQFDPATREAIRGLLDDPSVQVRREATDALGDLGDKEAAPLMAQMLSDADPGVRWEAIDSFADWGYKEAAPLIARMLGDSDANVRREALVALGTLGAGESSSSIAQLLSDPADQVREQAADVLGRLKARESTAVLLQSLNDPSDQVRGEAIASLGEIGAVEALPYLQDMYQRNPGRQGIRLVTAMRALGDEAPFRQEVQRLSQVALSSDDARTRSQAIQTLSWFAREESRDVFTRALQDPSERVRQEAERALRRRR
jgi:HEAT repeat protein